MLADTSEDYVVFLVLRGSQIDIEWLLQICSGHLRELGREDRVKRVERCLDGFSEKRSSMDVLLAYFRARELCRDVVKGVQLVSRDLASLLEDIQWTQPIYEHHDVCSKSLVEGLTALIPGIKLPVRHNKDLLGAVEALARVKVLATEKPDKYLKLYRKLTPKLRDTTIKQIRYFRYREPGD